MALTRTLRLEGRLAVRFTVGPTGAVVADELTAPLGDAAFQQCVLEAVRRWVFPAPADGGVVTVTYPFNFTMPDPPPAPAAPAAAPALPAARRR
jgi:TonB family protein